MRSKLRQTSKCLGRHTWVVVNIVCICCKNDVSCSDWFASNFGPEHSNRALTFNMVKFETVDVTGYWPSSSISEHFNSLHFDLLALNFCISTAVASFGFTLITEISSVQICYMDWNWENKYRNLTLNPMQDELPVDKLTPNRCSIAETNR